MSEEIRKIVKEEVAEALKNIPYPVPFSGSAFPTEVPSMAAPPSPSGEPPSTLFKLAPPPSPEEFQKAYPYQGFSAPLPSVLLRPLQQPIYDSEWYPRQGAGRLVFCQRHQGRSFAYPPNVEGDDLQGVKTSADTSLQQPGQLANPLEFSLFAFSVHFHGVSKEVKDAVTRDAEFMFLYTGNRIYLNTPLFSVPDPEDPYKIDYIAPTVPENYKTTADLTPEELLEHETECEELYRDALDRVSKDAEFGQRLLKFTIGKSSLRIRPTESFQIRMNWPNGAVPVKDPFKIYVMMHGLMWTPL